MLDPSFLDAIKGFEGFAPVAAWDYRQNTNGYGTRALYPGEPIDRDTAEQRFQAEIAKAAAHVDAVVPNAPQGAREALVSLTFNAGPGWSNSGLGQLVKAGDWQAAAERLQQYNKVGGEVNPGLVKRRAAEAQWFNAAPLGGAPQPTQSQVGLTQPAPAKPAISAQNGPPNAVTPNPILGYGQPPNNEQAASLEAQPKPVDPVLDEIAQLLPPKMLGGITRRPADFRKLTALIRSIRQG